MGFGANATFVGPHLEVRPSFVHVSVRASLRAAATALFAHLQSSRLAALNEAAAVAVPLSPARQVRVPGDLAVRVMMLGIVSAAGNVWSNAGSLMPALLVDMLLSPSIGWKEPSPVTVAV